MHKSAEKETIKFVREYVGDTVIKEDFIENLEKFLDSCNLQDVYCGWTVDDIVELAGDVDFEVTEKQAIQALELMEDRFDAGDGWAQLLGCLQEVLSD